MTSQSDAIDLPDVLRSLRRGRNAVIGYTVLGLVAAVAVILLVRPRFEGQSSVVLQTGDAGLSILTALSGGNAAPAILGYAGGALGGKTQVETELQILNSKAIAAQVIDSMRLQARVASPEGVPPYALVADVDLPGVFKKRKVRFSQAGDGSYRVAGSGVDTVIAGGSSVRFPIGTVTLRDTALPGEFTLLLLDREDALKWMSRRLRASKAGGEVARVAFMGDDSLSAAAVANAVVQSYLARRKTTDRGVNQHRVEFLEVQLDSTRRELAKAEQALRDFQEASGVMDATMLGKVQLERVGELRQALATVQVEEGSINQLLAQVDAGKLTVRQLAGYPAFIKSPSLNELLAQIGLLEAERQRLLERRTERDPEVVAVTQSIETVEGQFLPLARSYSSALGEQRSGISRELDKLRTELGVLPGAAQSEGRLHRDVLRLNQIHGAMLAQLVDARLAAVGEGGNVRQLDFAAVPKKPAFPQPVATMAIGGSVGLLCGIVAALVLAAFGRWARDPLEIERTTGVPTVLLSAGAPLVVAPAPARTVLVVPLGAGADSMSVAKHVVETALSRSGTATLLDLATGDAVVDGNGSALDANRTLERLSQEFETVVVRLPGIASRSTLALLGPNKPVIFVVPAGRVERDQLSSAMQTLRRLDAQCAGIVVSGTEAPRRLHALAT
jgi:tyrosine-protein kinase Etk/Wzc